MLLSERYEPEYVASVGNIFNIANTVAYFKGYAELQAKFEKAQDVLVKLIRDAHAPDVTEGALLREAFNLADQWISMHDTAILTRAINYANKQSVAHHRVAIAAKSQQ